VNGCVCPDIKIKLFGVRVYHVEYKITNHSEETFQFISCKHGYRGGQVNVSLTDEFNVTKGSVHILQPSGITKVIR